MFFTSHNRHQFPQFFSAGERIQRCTEHPENYNGHTKQAEENEKLQRLAELDFADHYFQRDLNYYLFPIEDDRRNQAEHLSVPVNGGKPECG